jgi:hypothetical protein
MTIYVAGQSIGLKCHAILLADKIYIDKNLMVFKRYLPFKISKMLFSSKKLKHFSYIFMTLNIKKM